MTVSAGITTVRRVRRRACLAGLSLSLAACGGGDGAVPASDLTPAAPTPGAPTPAKPERPDPQSLLSRPAVVRSPFALTDTSAYDGLGSSRLADNPYRRGDRRFLEGHGSFMGPGSHEAQASFARLMVRGRVVAIGRPYFNSEDGGFWDKSFYPDDPILRMSAALIFRDVVFDVDEVWATKLSGVAPGTRLRFAVGGGAVRVELTGDAARKMEMAPGSHVWIWPPDFDLAVGEEVVLLLDKGPIGGPYGGRPASAGR